MISARDLEAAVGALEIDHAEVCIHSSLKSFGEELESGLDGLLNAFLARDCTVMVPTFSYDYCQNPIEPYMPERNGIDYETAFDPQCDRSRIFDTESKNISVGHMGKLSKFVLDAPGSRRGNHPINSFTAIGRNAERLTAVQRPQEVYAPFQQLMDDGGYVLLMGVGLDRATILHYAEQLAGRNLFIRWANDQNGRVIPIPGGGCSTGFHHFEPLLTVWSEVMVGKSLWRCYKAADLVEVCRKAILDDPGITHCGNPNCRLCNDAVLGGPRL